MGAGLRGEESEAMSERIGARMRSRGASKMKDGHVEVNPLCACARGKQWGFVPVHGVYVWLCSKVGGCLS